MIYLKTLLLSLLILFPMFTEAKEEKLLDEINNYLNSFNSFSANFKELNNASEKKGEINILKPGKLKLEYLSPKKITIILNDGTIMYYEHELEEISYIKENNYFFNLLAQEKIDIKKLVQEVSVDANQKVATLKISKKHNNVETKVSIVLCIHPIELREIIFQNEEQLAHHLFFHNIKYNPNLPSDSFSLKDPNFYSEDYDND